MKRMIKKTGTLLIAAGFLFSYAVSGQTNAPASQTVPTGGTVIRSERPVPDYSKVSPADIIPGIIRIKFREGFSDHLQAEKTATGSNGLVRFGINGVDELNRLIGVTAVRPSFDIALRNTSQEVRHRQWGLHLWYDLTLSPDLDMRDIREQFADLQEIEIAEVLVKATLSSYGNEKKTAWIPEDSLFSMQWHYHNTGQAGGTPDCDIDLPEAWDIETGDTGVVVAIMDQGVEYDHPDLTGNMWPGIGYNFYADTSLIEKCLHGTHVAGTIAANTNNGIGVSGIAGGTGSGDGARIMSCQIISAENQVVEENIPSAFIWAADRGAAISQNSWNFPLASPSLFEAIDYFIANGGGSAMNGGIMICSAGNADSNMISWPACYAPCIAVAATSNQDKRSFYSNYGAWVSISAPGGNFYPFNEEDILSTVPGGEYGYLMGTSMACPHVSGVAALIVSSAKGLLSAGDLKDILLNSTDDISSLNPEYEGMIGTGRLNAYKALIMTQGYKDPSIPKPAVAFSAGAGNSGTMNLHWEPNATSDSVLLAFGTVNKFGTPAGSYNPGDTILHGGKVLFKGKLSDFVQTGLDSGTVCYYSLWSVRNNTYSLVARKASDTVNSSPYGIGEGAIPATNTIRIVPNPSVHSATLHFMLAEPGEVVFIVSDQTGRKVNRIAYRSSQAGEQTLPISLQEWPAGVYFIRMEAADRTAEGKLVVVAR